MWALNTLGGHRRKGFGIHISINNLESLAKKIIYCLYCGMELDWTSGNKNNSPKLNSPSLDRINNEKELRMDNIRILCYGCNRTKGNKTHKDFIIFCNKISQKFEI